MMNNAVEGKQPNEPILTQKGSSQGGVALYVYGGK